MTPEELALTKGVMLSAKLITPKNPDFDTQVKYVQWPKLGSTKIDGIRAFVAKGKLYSRRLKLIPNLYTQDLFGIEELNGLDGELVVGEPTNLNCMQATGSGVMTRGFKPKVRFYVFDDYTHPGGFIDRLDAVYRRVQRHGDPRLVWLEHEPVKSVRDLLKYEIKCLEAGYEGVMLREPNGPYKHGRSTMVDNYLMALKRRTDAEAVIIGYEELVHNDNPATTDEFGRTKRASNKANLRLGGTMGALQCRTPAGVEFSVGGGPGLTAEARALLWANRKKLIGMYAKYSFIPVGVKTKPRMPQFLGLRHPDDM